MKVLINFQSDNIKNEIIAILSLLNNVKLSEIQNGDFEIAFSNKELLLAKLTQYIVDQQASFVTANTSNKIFFVIGSSYLGTEFVLQQLKANASIKQAYTFIPEYVEIKDLIFDHATLLENDEWQENLGYDEIFSLIFHFNSAMKHAYDRLKLEIIDYLIRHCVNVASCIEPSHLPALTQSLNYAFDNNYAAVLLDHDIADNHADTVVENFNKRFGTNLANDRKNYNRLVNMLTVKSSFTHIRLLSKDNLDQQYPYVSYLFNASLISADVRLAPDAQNIIQTINAIPVNDISKTNAFSRPYVSYAALKKQGASISPHAIPVFDERHFYPVDESLKLNPNVEYVKKKLKFRPERLLLHLIITKIYTTIVDAKSVAATLLSHLYQNKSTQIETLTNQINDFYQHTQQNLYPELNEINPLQSSASEFTNLYAFNNIFAYMEDNISELLFSGLDEKFFKKLKLFKKSEATATFLLGGSGGGKTTYKQLLAKNNDTIVTDALFLNIDDLFDVLYGNDSFCEEIIFSDWSFQETLLLHDRIINQVIAMSIREYVPNLYYEGLYFLENLLVAYQVSKIDLTFLSLPLDVAISRVYHRERALVNPLGAQFILYAYKKNSLLLKDFIDSYRINNYKHCHLTISSVDLDVNKNYMLNHIAEYSVASQTLSIFRFDTIFRYFMAAEINVYADSYQDIYTTSKSDNVIGLLKTWFAKAHVLFTDVSTQMIYLEIDGKFINVADDFLFEVNFDPWALEILRSIISTSASTNDAVNDIFQSGTFPNVKNSVLSGLLFLIKELYKFLYAHHSLLNPAEQKCVSSLIAELAILFENHVVNPVKILHTLNSGLNDITLPDAKNRLLILRDDFERIITACAAMKDNVVAALNEPLFTRWDDRIDTSAGRYYESEFSRQIMQTPPALMMKVIGETSQSIIFSLEANKHKVDSHIISYFLNRLHKSHAAYARFPHIPMLAEVYQILATNDPKNIAQIILIHFVFADVCYRNFIEFDLSSDAQMQALAKVWNPQQIVFDTKEKISHLMNVHLYGSPLLKNRNRGVRPTVNPLCNYDFYAENSAFSSYYGILRHGSIPLFGNATYSWRQDRYYSIPYPTKSKMTYDMMLAEVPFISGASGMSTLFLPSALLAGRIKTKTDFTYYLLAVASYLAHGGLHSWHETLVVAQDRLNLLHSEAGSYQVEGPQIANFNFVINLLKDDAEITRIRAFTWQNMLRYTAMTYAERIFNYGNTLQKFTNIEHDHFKNEMTKYDLDRLHIKLLEIRLIQLPKDKNYFENYNILNIIEDITAVTKSLQTARSLEELDGLLAQFHGSLFNYQSRFMYSPQSLWSDLNSLMTEMYNRYKAFENKNFAFYSNALQSATLSSGNTASLRFFPPIEQRTNEQYTTDSHPTHERKNAL